MKRIIIIGAGPAGLAAAYELCRTKDSKLSISLFETDDQVGGISKTLQYKGYRFDLGGHRFYTKIQEIDQFYKSFLGKNLLKRKRLSRIYYEKKFYDYPLTFMNALTNLGFLRSVEIVLSWFYRQLNRYKMEKTFDKWISNRFGDKLFHLFFKSYTEKVWGISTSKLSSDWAAQRIQNFNLFRAVLGAILSLDTSDVKTIIRTFFYPKYGPGMLYEELQRYVEKKGVNVYMNHKVTGLKRTKNKVTHVLVKDIKKGIVTHIKADAIISTMPFNELISLLHPPEKLTTQVKSLRFRNFITVNLLLKKNPFPDQWVYVHEPDVKVGRIQNFRNWSPYMVKKGGGLTPVGMEYFCSEGDKMWKTTDAALISLAKEELARIGLAKEEDIREGFVYRVKNAYPIYNFDYDGTLKLSKKYASNFKNLFLCGRGGLFRYNNQDHSILTGFFAARSVFSTDRKHDRSEEHTSELQSR